MRNAAVFPIVAKLVFVLGFIMSAATSSCSDPSDVTNDLPDASDSADPNDSSDESDSSNPGKSLAMEMGIAKYAGQITPHVLKESGNITTYRFDPSQGPVCMRGGEFLTSVRDVGAEDLVVFLQEGGVCTSEYCFAGSKALEGIPNINILNPKMEENPVADWNHVFVPYCDGSMFSGDAEHDDNVNNRGKRYHYGLANMTAALEAIKMRFPNPERVLLAGSSGGAYGLLFGGILTRHYYPDAELILMFDSGIGIGRDDDPEFIKVILDEFEINQFLPKDCAKCKGDIRHLTALAGYALKRDPHMRAGMFSSWNDTILTNVYLRISGAQFAASLEQQTDPIHAAYPNRFRRFIIDGVQHCTLFGNPSTMGPGNWNSLEMPPGGMQTLVTGNIKIGRLKATRIGELTMTDWLAALIDNDTDVWVDIQE